MIVNRNAQIAITDLFVALLILTILIVSLVIFLGNNTRLLDEQVVYNDIVFTSEHIADILVSAKGTPSNWDGILIEDVSDNNLDDLVNDHYIDLFGFQGNKGKLDYDKIVNFMGVAESIVAPEIKKNVQQQLYNEFKNVNNINIYEVYIEVDRALTLSEIMDENGINIALVDMQGSSCINEGGEFETNYLETLLGITCLNSAGPITKCDSYKDEAAVNSYLEPALDPTKPANEYYDIILIKDLQSSNVDIPLLQSWVSRGGTLILGDEMSSSNGNFFGVAWTRNPSGPTNIDLHPNYCDNRLSGSYNSWSLDFGSICPGPSTLSVKSEHYTSGANVIPVYTHTDPNQFAISRWTYGQGEIYYFNDLCTNNLFDIVSKGVKTAILKKSNKLFSNPLKFGNNPDNAITKVNVAGISKSVILENFGINNEVVPGLLTLKLWKEDFSSGFQGWVVNLPNITTTTLASNSYSAVPEQAHEEDFSPIWDVEISSQNDGSFARAIDEAIFENPDFDYIQFDFPDLGIMPFENIISASLLVSHKDHFGPPGNQDFISESDSSHNARHTISCFDGSSFVPINTYPLIHGSVLVEDIAIDVSNVVEECESSLSRNLNFQVTIPNAPNKILIVQGACEDSNDDDCDFSKVQYARFGSSDLSLAVNQLSDNSGYVASSAIFYLLDDEINVECINSFPCTKNVDIRMNNRAVNLHGGAYLLYNVDQLGATTIFSHGQDPASSNYFNTNINTLTDKSWVIDVAAVGNTGTFVPDEDQIEVWQQSCIGSSSISSRKLVNNMENTNVGHTHSDINRFAHSMIVIEPFSTSLAPWTDVTFDLSSCINNPSLANNVNLRMSFDPAFRAKGHLDVDYARITINTI